MARKAISKRRKSGSKDTSNEEFDHRSEKEARGILNKPIYTYDDIDHDSEEEYFEQQENISFSSSKKDSLDEHDLTFDKKTKTVSLEFDNQEQVFSIDNSDSESGSEHDAASQDYSSESDLDDAFSPLDSEHDEEQAELDEQTEAIRLQKRFVSAMEEADYGLTEQDSGLFDSSTSKDSTYHSNVFDIQSTMSKVKRSAKDTLFGNDTSFSSSHTSSSSSKSRISLDRDTLSKLSSDELFKLTSSRYPELVGMLDQLEHSYKKSEEYLSLINSTRDTFGAFISKTIKPFIPIESAYQLHCIVISNIAFYLMLISNYQQNDSSAYPSTDPKNHPVLSVISNALDALDKIEPAIPNFSLMLSNKIKSKLSPKPEKVEPETKSKANSSFLKSSSKSKKKPSKTKKNKTPANLESSLGDNNLFNDQEFSNLVKQFSQSSSKSKSSLSSSTKSISKSAKKSIKRKESQGSNSDSEGYDYGESETEENIAADRVGDHSSELLKNNSRHSLRSLASKAVRTANKSKKEKKKIVVSGDMDSLYIERDKKSKLRRELETKEHEQHYEQKQFRSFSDDDNDMSASDTEALNRNKSDSKQPEKNQKRSRKEDKGNVPWRKVLDYNLAKEKSSTVVSESDRKRGINYQIYKNKGLTPKRRKIDRNPRVKRRVKYDSAKKKLASSRAVYKQPTSSYGGETTGIKTHLSKS
ncbi:hypothetical protein BB560_004975, partial [Smittium megazygosporum]